MIRKVIEQKIFYRKFSGTSAGTTARFEERALCFFDRSPLMFNGLPGSHLHGDVEQAFEHEIVNQTVRDFQPR